jgi:hypothetical protein
MPLDYKNRAEIMDRDPKLGEALDDILGVVGSVAKQTNASLNGQTAAPRSPSALSVTASHGIFEAAINDNNSAVNRGVNYFLEYSKTPSFNSPHQISLGPSRNWRGNLGNVPLYFRAHSSYLTSPRSAPVYHGTATSPRLVIGGGSSTGPDLMPSNGSGTSSGASGSDGAFGNSPFRGNTPPTS